MKIYTLRRTQFIARPIDDVFRFFSMPENLEKITPKSLGFTILTPRPIDMGKGTLIDYTISLMGFLVHWRTLISDYNPPHSFIDQQIKGPYAFWHHTHTFTEKDGGTEIIDEVLYSIPFWFLGRIVNTLWIKSELKKIFDYRKDIIEQELG